MHASDVVLQLLVVLAASLLAVGVLGRLRFPSIVSFLAAGIAIGPHGAKLVTDLHLIEVLAEVGVVLLMFTIGLKFSIAELAKMKGLVLGAGVLQVLLTTAACLGIGSAAGLSPPQATFLGFLVAMSSTAIVLKILEEKAETESPHGRLSTGILIFQDLAVVPLMLVTPMLAGEGGTFGEAAARLGTSLLLIAVILVAARFVLPRLFAAVVRTRSREVFTLATMLVILATAAAAGAAGLSLALGALIAGVVLSESDYAHQVLSDVVPLRDLLASLFFVSVGMLVDATSWTDEPLTTFGLSALVLGLKGFVVWAIGRGFGMGPRISLLAGLALGQIGEFSFVLALSGRGLALLDEHSHAVFLSVSVTTMALTPFLLMLSPWLARKTADRAGGAAAHGGREGHVIVVGYGVTGSSAATVLRDLGVGVLVVELNADTVRRLRASGHDAQFGDASREDVLRAAGLAGAKALVLTALDPVATRQTVAMARRVNPGVRIFVRTRFVKELAELRHLGADAVVPEELEASIALATRVMRSFGATEQAASRAAAALRGEDYELLRDAESTEARRVRMLDEVLQATEFDEVPLAPAHAGRTLRDLDLRRRTGALVVALRRGQTVLPNPAADLPFAEGDVLVVAARPAEAEAARTLLGGPA